jgi:uncharacterized membrane protein YgcG
MSRILSILTAALFAVVLVTGVTVAGQPTTQAASGDTITRFDVQATAQPSGAIDVTQTIDMQFAGSGHGPILWLVTRQTYDSSHDRLLTYDHLNVTSPTGAPTDRQVTQENAGLTIRIGDEDVTVRGTQTYVISYTLSGVVNLNVEDQNRGTTDDQIFWNVIGSGWELPISNISVSLTGPTSLTGTNCHAGAKFDQPCTSHNSTGSTATYTQASVQPGEGFDVVGGWPVGTFANGANLVSSSQNPFDVSNGGAISAGVAGVATVAGGWLLTRLRKKGRDEQYADVTPGAMPVEGDAVTIKHEEVKDAPVEYAPPAGVPPRLVGAVVREGTSNEDITATIIDLAVRGHIQMVQGEGKDFTFRRTTLNPATLPAVERQIYDGLFAGRNSVTRDDLSDKEFYETYSGFQSTLRDEFDHQRWYKVSPRAVVTFYSVLGVVIAGGGAAVSIWAGMMLAKQGVLGIGWLALPFVVVGLGMLALAKRMPVRTATGSAVAIQSLGFKKYLETAEADQLRWEENQDIFSAYLPYAIAFGCADRWAKIFEQLAAQGAPVPEPTWYVGSYAYNYLMWSSIVHSIDSIGSSITESAMANAAADVGGTLGSSGGSGFGSVGGGVGGGGGGSW